MLVRRGDRRGFSLIEVLCGMAILMAVSLGVAPLFVLATRANLDARFETMAVVLATEGMEQLRAARAYGAPPAGGASERVEYLGADGTSLDEGPRPPPLAVYVRRSSVAPLPGGVAGSALLRVRVTRMAAEAAASADHGRRVVGEVRLIGIDPRHAP